MIPCILVKIHLSFREAFLLYLQGPYSPVAIACCIQLQEPTSLGILKITRSYLDSYMWRQKARPTTRRRVTIYLSKIRRVFSYVEYSLSILSMHKMGN